MKKTLGILGVGHLAVHIVDGLSRSPSTINILVSPRNAQIAARLVVKHGVTIARDNQQLVDLADMVLVCLPAGSGLDILSELKFRQGQQVCSAMAGVGWDAITEAAAPADVIVSMMPGAANAIGKGPCLIYPNDLEWHSVLSGLGRVIPCETQSDFNTAAVFGAFSGASIMFMIQMAQWFTDQGLSSQTARQLVAETIAGNAEVLGQSLGEWDQIIASVATPGGITEELVSHLQKADALTAWSEGLSKILERQRGE